MNKQNKIIVGVIALVLALTVGYALFNSSLTINGTAKASGEFAIKFKEVGEIRESGSKGATAEITGSNNEVLTVNVPNLEYPTSYVEIPVTVVNDGTIDGKLTGITVENLETDDIKVTYSGISDGEVFKQQEEKPMLIKIMWKDNSEVDTSNLTFQIGLKYQQITVADITNTSSSNTNKCTTFDKKDTYSVGDVIALCNNETGKSEDFYVIKDNGDTVTALAKYSLLVGNTFSFKTFSSR